VIGGGKFGEMHLRAFTQMQRDGQAVLVALCDINEELAKKRKDQWGARRHCTDYLQILQADDIDAVEILSPHKLHHSMVIKAARAGKHVSVQKPMCISIPEGREMIQACKQAGVLFKIFENFVFYPPYRRAKELLEEGEIGEPLSINIKLGNGVGGWWVPLKTWLWRINWDECGGGPAIYDDGYHKMSIARFFLGDIESVKAWVDFIFGVIDSPALITWRHKQENRLGVWETNMSPHMQVNGRYYTADERVELVGTKGMIWVTRCTSRLMEIPPLIIYKDGRSTAFDDMRDDWADSFYDSGRDFIDCILEGRTPTLTGEDGLALMQFWKAIYNSYEKGIEVRPDDMTE